MKKLGTFLALAGAAAIGLVFRGILADICNALLPFRLIAAVIIVIILIVVMLQKYRTHIKLFLDTLKNIFLYTLLFSTITEIFIYVIVK